MKQLKCLVLLLIFLLSACGCGAETVSAEPPVASAVTQQKAEPQAAASTPSPVPTSTPEPSPVPTPDPFAYTEKLFSGDVVEIDISVAEEDWDYLLAHAEEKPWISADVTVNGEAFSHVGVKTKGNTSLMSIAHSDSDRYSFKLSFGKYEDGQTCWGLNKLALNNIYADNTYLKEYMSYHLFRYMGVPASLCAFCQVSVNGEPFGFYLTIEDTDKSFLARYGGVDNKLEAYKPESMDFGGGKPAAPVEKVPEEEAPQDVASPEETTDGQDGATPQENDSPGFPGGDGGGFPGFPRGGAGGFPGGFPGFPGFPGGGNGGFPGGMDGGVSLQYTDDNPESYGGIFENGITKISEKDQTRLIIALKGIGEGEDLEQYINVDEVLRYTACNVFLVSLDSYFSMMGHNYVLVENRGQLSMVPWDYNLSFGTHNISTASEAVNYPIDTVFSGVTAEQRPIIGKLLEVDEYRQRYHDYLRQICEDYVGDGVFDEEIDRVTGMIDGYVQTDESSFAGYEAFQAGIPALRLYGALRTESILGQLDGVIPSTSEEQSDSTALVDASALDLSLLGSMNLGGPPGAP